MHDGTQGKKVAPAGGIQLKSNNDTARLTRQNCPATFSKPNEIIGRMGTKKAAIHHHRHHHKRASRHQKRASSEANGKTH